MENGNKPVLFCPPNVQQVCRWPKPFQLLEMSSVDPEHLNYQPWWVWGHIWLCGSILVPPWPHAYGAQGECHRLYYSLQFITVQKMCFIFICWDTPSLGTNLLVLLSCLLWPQPGAKWHHSLLVKSLLVQTFAALSWPEGKRAMLEACHGRRMFVMPHKIAKWDFSTDISHLDFNYVCFKYFY